MAYDPKILKVQRRITNAEIKALRSTPISLISAPGSGKAITVVQFTVRLNYGGNNVFVTGGNLTLYATNTSGIPIAATNAAVYTAAIDKTYGFVPGFTVTSGVGTLENQAIVLSTATSDPTGNAANDNTLDVEVLYHVVSF